MNQFDNTEQSNYTLKRTKISGLTGRFVFDVSTTGNISELVFDNGILVGLKKK